MSTVMRPAGRQRRQVYWRRRALALVLVALVVVALVLGVRSLFGGGDPETEPAGSSAPVTSDPATSDPASADAPSTDPAPSAEGSAPPAAEGEVTTCDPAAVQVVATADATAYPLGTTAKVGMTITNVGAAACSLDAGSAALELLVVSGSDRIWSSDDCQTGAESRVVEVPPGEGGMLASSVDWSLGRSAAGCAEGLPDLQPGTYQLTARAGDVTSAPLVLQLQ